MIWMKNGIFKGVLVAIVSAFTITLSAQSDSTRFDRPSLCLMMIAHPEQAFGKEIEIVFREMDMPERFNDHSLGVRVVKFPSDDPDKTVDNILGFANHAQLAKKMVAKWFSRDKQSGTFSTDYLINRGYYNATKQEVIISQGTIRGWALLGDAGEKLVNRTFLVMCDYTYNRAYSSQDNSENKQKLSNTKLDMDDANAVDEFNNHLYQRDNRLRNFDITCTSYLFQLQWTDSVANIFYLNHYTETPDPMKGNAFNHDHTTYALSYLGSCTDSESVTNENGQYNNQQLIKKACIRLRDKNLSTLQHAHPEFRIKAPLVGVDPIKAYIGRKEDVKPGSRYEALELQVKKDGTYDYKRIGVIQPISDKIWDNRYMATDDIISDLDATYFKKISGGEFYPGLLIREIDK